MVSATMDVWSPLARALGSVPPASLTSPEGGRLGAALVLLSEPVGAGDVEVVYTRRREDLSTHPGQVSFPGGRVDPGETVEQAALREAVEEVALDPGSVEILGRLSAFYIPPSRFWLQPVVARWRVPHRLTAAEDEVAEVLRVPLCTLRDESTWRVVRLSSGAQSWAWQLDERNLLWGATAIVTAELLGMIDPHWHGGADLARLLPDREVRPWETPAARPPARRFRLAGLAERPWEALPSGGGANRCTRPSPRQVAVAGEGVAAAVGALEVSRTATRGVLVLAGAGGNGAVGLDVARRLLDRGLQVRVVLARPPDRLRPVAAEALSGVADRAVVFDGELPVAGAVVDALVGAGLSGPLRGGERDVVLALRHHDVPIVSVDLPSGLHPMDGLLGDCVSADVTVALSWPWPGLSHAGLAPFVGDLCVVGFGENGDGALVRVVSGEPAGRRRG